MIFVCFESALIAGSPILDSIYPTSIGGSGLQASGAGSTWNLLCILPLTVFNQLADRDFLSLRSRLVSGGQNGSSLGGD